MTNMGFVLYNTIYKHYIPIIAFSIMSFNEKAIMKMTGPRTDSFSG